MLEQATKLDSLFLKNKMNYDLKMSSVEEENIFIDYYLKTCEYIYENHIAKPSINLIERVLSGLYLPFDKNYSIVCTISDRGLKEYLFKRAMAKQLIYDMENGRSSMQKGDHSFDVCPEFKHNLSLLGFIKPGMFSKEG